VSAQNGGFDQSDNLIGTIVVIVFVGLHFFAQSPNNVFNGIGLDIFLGKVFRPKSLAVFCCFGVLQQLVCLRSSASGNFIRHTVSTAAVSAAAASAATTVTAAAASDAAAAETTAAASTTAAEAAAPPETAEAA
jgi:hypothetical protein